MTTRLSQAEISSIVEAGGGRYVGVLSEIPRRKLDAGIPLFKDTFDRNGGIDAKIDTAFGGRNFVSRNLCMTCSR